MVNKLFCTFVLCSLFSAELKAQNVYFSYSNGTNSTFAVNDIRKIFFNADVMTLMLWNGTEYSWNVSTVGGYGYDPQILGVNELVEKLNNIKFSVYPNPVSDLLNIEFHLDGQENIQLKLIDANGNVTVNQDLGARPVGYQQDSMNLRGLSSGVYVVHLVGNSFHISKKVIVE